MSAPAFAWAVEQGRRLALSASQRLVLIVLADRANGKRVCWPSLKCLTKDTGLVERTVFSVVHQLQAAGLIRIERRGRGQDYHILRPDDDGEPTQPLHRSARKPVQPLHRSNGAPTASKAPQPTQPLRQSEPQPQQPLHELPVDNSSRPMQSTQRSMQPFPPTDATIADKPVRNLRTNLAGEEAQELRAAGDGGSSAYSAAAEPEAEPVPAAQRMAAQTMLGKLVRRLESPATRPAGKYPAHSVDEQIASASQKSPTIADIHPAVLPAVLAARAALMARPVQRQSVHA